jgi:arsenate reductase-like glutaredoxin family protein
MKKIKKIRIFGTSNCKSCLKALSIIKKTKVVFDYIDANEDDDGIQDFCDEHEVDELPHVQIIHNDRVVKEHIGPLDEKDFLLDIDYYFKARDGIK